MLKIYVDWLTAESKEETSSELSQGYLEKEQFSMDHLFRELQYGESWVMCWVENSVINNIASRQWAWVVVC